MDLDYVASPYLHILVHIVKKHHDLLEKDRHTLGKQIAKSLPKTSEDVESNFEGFQHYVHQLKSKEGKKQQPQKLQSCVASMGDAMQKETVHQKIKEL